MACTAAEPDQPTLEVSLAELVPTVMVVEWTTETPTRGKVIYGITGEEPLETPWEHEATVAHRRTILGMPVDTAVQLQGFGEDGTETAPATETTGSAPPDLPTLAAAGGEATWEGWIFPGTSGSPGGVLAYDNQSRLVWWWISENDTSLVLRAAPALDGNGVYANLTATDFAGLASMVRISWTGEVVQQQELDGLTHDFIEVEPGLIGGIVREAHTTEQGQACATEAIEEFYIGEPATPIWDAWDSYAYPELVCPDPEIEASWTHVNAIDYDPELGVYTAGSRNLNTITSVDRASGDVTFSFGDVGDIGYSPGTSPMLMQHQFQRLSNGNMLVFDDGNPDRAYSRLIEYAIDETSRQASEAWVFEADRSRYVFALGDVERLDSGNTLATWSTLGLIEEITPEGSPVWQMQTPLGYTMSYVTRATNLYGEQAGND